MTVTEWTCAVLGIGGGLVALINLIGNRLARRDKVKDAAAEAAERRNDAAAQVEELRSETAEQFERVDTRFRSVESKIDTIDKRTDAVAASSRAQLYNTISHLSMKYIKIGAISAEELKALSDMHAAYKLLGGDGFLDRLMDEVNKLKIQ